MSEHRFRLKRGDFEVEFAGDRDFVEAQIARFAADGLGTDGVVADGQAVPRAEAVGKVVDPVAELPRVAPDFRPKVNTSISQFVAMKGAALPADVFIVGVYYLEKYQRRETFLLQELQDLLSVVPAWECQRTEDVVEEAQVRGHVEMLRDGSWSITFMGQNYVREGLS